MCAIGQEILDMIIAEFSYVFKILLCVVFFFSSRRRHTRWNCDWSSDVCSSDLLEKAGGRAGADINGTTSWDRTNYFEQVPSNQLDLALWLEADRMGTLTETLTKEKLDNQREVVKNERRQSFDNQPYGSWIEKMLSYVYPESHP